MRKVQPTKGPKLCETQTTDFWADQTIHSSELYKELKTDLFPIYGCWQNCKPRKVRSRPSSFEWQRRHVFFCLPDISLASLVPGCPTKSWKLVLAGYSAGGGPPYWQSQFVGGKRKGLKKQSWKFSDKKVYKWLQIDILVVFLPHTRHHSAFHNAPFMSEQNY